MNVSKSMLGALALSSVFFIPSAAFAQTDFVFGSVRVQFLTPRLVRVEQKGPSGFENRETFNVLRPYWGPVKVKESTSADGSVLTTDFLTVKIATAAKDISAASVYDRDGKLLFQWEGKPPAPSYLPAPTEPQDFVFADYPRIVPPAWGATPAPAGNTLNPETSGWDVSDGAPDVYVMFEPNARTLYKTLTKLTGPTELPPLYLFGFWNSRWEPYTEKTADAEMGDYRKKGFPLDLFVLDTNWRVGGSHGYDPATNLFPDMKRFMDHAHSMGVKIMMNDHPEPIGPAASPKELNFRWTGLDSQFKNGLDVWWFDRNWGTHLGTPAEGLPLEVWGMRLYHDMTAKAHSGRRPLIMSNVSGIDNGSWNYAPIISAHRYPIWWTGDTSSQWRFLQYGVKNMVNSGVETLTPYQSEDLGGHIGMPSPELYTRYLEYGSLSPVDRVHCTYELTRVPWAFGKEAENTVRKYIKLRYRLQPMFYDAARQNYDTGVPMMRRLDLDYGDAPADALADEYTIGANLLIAPVTESQDHRGEAVPAAMLGGGLTGEYFANTDLKGEPAFVRKDDRIAFDWSSGGPGGKIGTSNYSVRWKGTLGPVAKTGDYTFTTTTDDGVRLFVNGKKLVDYWVPQDNVAHDVKIHMEAGKTYPIELDYSQIGGNALCSFTWVDPNAPAIPKTRKVWIPDGSWHDMWSGSNVTGPQWIEAPAPLSVTPMYAKVNSIVLTAPEVMYTGQKPWDPITVDAFADAPGSGEQTLYEDDGNSTQYKNGQFAKTKVSLKTLTNSVWLGIGPREGSYAGMITRRGWIVRIHLAPGQTLASTQVELDGKQVTAKVIEPGSVPDITLKGAGTAEGPKGGAVVELQIPAGKPSQGHEVRIRVTRNADALTPGAARIVRKS